MMGQFEKLTIDNILSNEETGAIDALGRIKKDDLKTALNTEKLKGTTQTFLEMADVFSTYNVVYKEASSETDDYGNVTTTEEGLSCDEKAPKRLKDMIADKDENDFAYFIYKISEILNLKVTNLEKKTINKKTKEQLILLKTEIELSKIVSENQEQNQEDDQEQNQGENKENEEEKKEEEKMVILDMKNLTKLYFKDDTTAEILKAEIEGYTFANNDIKKKVYAFINEGEIAELQEYLYKQTGGKNTMKSRRNGRRDGKFGPGTLKGVENISTITMEKTPEEMKKILNPVAPTYTAEGGGKTESKDAGEEDKFLNKIITITSVDELPKNAEGKYERSEKKVYDITIDGVFYRFYGNGRVSVGRKEMKDTVDVLDNYGNVKVIITLDELPKDYKRQEKKVYDLRDGTKRYHFYGNGRTYNKKEGTKPTADVIADIKKILETNTNTTNKEFVQERINNDLFDVYVDGLKKGIKKSNISSHFTNHQNPTIKQAFSESNWEMKVTTYIQNPNVRINIMKAGTNIPSYALKINLAEFTDTNTGGDRKINMDKFFGAVDKYILQDIEKKEAEKIQTEKRNNYRKSVASLRGKTYSISDLFPKLDEYQKAKYEAFFRKFTGEKVLIDSSDWYTMLLGENIKFDLDQEGSFDDDFVQNIQIPMKDITDEKGNLNEDSFKKKLADKITEIVDTHYKE